MVDDHLARIAVLEEQVRNLDEKLDEVKVEVQKMHDCLDRTRDDLSTTLKEMRKEASTQHSALSLRLEEFEKIKTKWTYLVLGAIAAAGWLSHNPVVLKLFSGE
jgi:predicted nuclease with TOPRIM domain